MPRIFDNIERSLLPALQSTLQVADRADFCVGYFNLRGWKQLDSHVDRWSGGDGHCCRLLVGMQRLPQDELYSAIGLSRDDQMLDNQAALRLKKRLAQEFRDQLAVGVPTNEDEAGLQRLAAQIRAGKVVVKLYLRHPLHAKLYLLFRPDIISPTVGYLGSSNLTMAGLSHQGELNVDVVDEDACHKLAGWFEERWNDRWCLDISSELVQIIDESWAREELIPPYHIYVKMAYHLSQEAIAGISEFTIPREFGNRLFEFQKKAVQIAARHVNKRGGVLIGDVVGLGKTLMATTLARVFEDDQGLETLILCPKNLVAMWEDYRVAYRLHATVMSYSQVTQELPRLRRYRLLILDESHNLRNREGKRYRAIQEYIEQNESRCILLSATPYNKSYQDLSSQLRLFVPEDRDLGVRPEQAVRKIGETEFLRRHQCPIRSLAAFEKSEYPDDWRELMRLYMVRRTRSFIQDNYAETDGVSGRRYLTFADGSRSYFPTREPRTVKFRIDDADPLDQYARLYSVDAVATINGLTLPRYGLGNYVSRLPQPPATPDDQLLLHDLSRAGKRLMGFCRTGLFKRMESSGHVFLESIERHILRNYVFVHALETGQPLPLGTQGAEMLDTSVSDLDPDSSLGSLDLFEDDGNGGPELPEAGVRLRTEEDFRRQAALLYRQYAGRFRRRFKWARPTLFTLDLEKDLRRDADALRGLLERCGDWDPSQDTKLEALHRLLMEKHPWEKVLVFTQFADTVRYLEWQLSRRFSVTGMAGVTGDSADPTALVWRFSPNSNNKRDRVRPEEELRVLVSTDILSEGQNLQDCAIVVNYDLPWAIIRLIQRAGRVDRIGQKAEEILCYSFLPAEGVERVLNLRSRVRRRLQENAEVVGTDEAFFEDEEGEIHDRRIVNLYNERSGTLDEDPDSEVDLASFAYQIWKNAVDADPSLQRVIPQLPPVVYSTKSRPAGSSAPEGVLVYVRTGEGTDQLAWIGNDGRGVTESQLAILRAAECLPNTPAQPRQDRHHDLVEAGVRLIGEEERSVGGQLGRPTGARFKSYEKLKRYVQQARGTFFETPELQRAIEEIYRYPLRPTATDTLNRQLRAGITDEVLADLVVRLRDDGRLCNVQEDGQRQEAQIICSMGLVSK